MVGLWCLLAIACTAAAQSAEPFICSAPSPAPNSPPLPDLPNRFTARIEANIVNRGYTVDVVEYYDEPENRGRLEVSRPRLRSGSTGGSTIIYTFADMQSFRINNTDNTCKAQTISPTNRFNPFGPSIDAQGNAHIRGAADLFRFGKQFGETYMGRDVAVRGIAADRWRSCMNTTSGGNMTIDWYFASANWTTTAVGQPLRAVIEGVDPMFNPQTRMANFSVLHYFKHYYDFTLFAVGQPDSSLFQIPKGIFCDGGKVARNLPNVPNGFSVRFQSFAGQEITHAQEYFDTASQKFYVKGYNSQYGIYSVYQDLELGVSYTFTNSSTCLVSNLTSKTLDDFPGERYLAIQSPDNPSHLQFRSVRELWGFLRGANVSYVGTRTVNDVLCDVWQEERSDTGNATIYEVSFSKPSLGYRLSHKTLVEHQVPVRMEFYSKSLIGKPPGQKKPWEFQSYTNVYEFDMSPSSPKINLLPCFQESATFWFQVQGAYSKIAQSIEDFEDAVAASISSSAGVYQSRVAGVHILPSNDDNGNMVVEGTILGKLSVPTYKDTGPALNAAMGKLRDTINSGSGLRITYGGDAYTSLAQSFSQSPGSSESSSGYSGGVVAAIAIAMVVVGALIGAVVLYFVMKRRGEFQMNYKTQVD